MFDTIKTAYALKNGVNKRSVYNWHAPVFLFTNENIAGYLEQLGDMSGKDVLAVAGSGDHAFESLLHGANHVDTFDVNYLQKHVMELKSKMIKYLPYNEFMRFFFNKKYFFNCDIIRPIWNTFSPALRIFLKTYYKTKNEYMFRYRDAQSPFYTIDKISYIADEKAYEHLGKIMPDKIKFEHTDLLNIANKLDNIYDIILLSNISEYMYEEIQDLGTKNLFLCNNIISHIADKYLTDDGGHICFGYAWHANPEHYQKMADLIKRHTKYSIDNFDTTDKQIDTIAVPSAYNALMVPEDRPDIVTIMTQKVR